MTIDQPGTCARCKAKVDDDGLSISGGLELPCAVVDFVAYLCFDCAQTFRMLEEQALGEGAAKWTGA